MDAVFWHERWHTNQLGFHQPAGNALFAEYFEKLNLLKGSRIFVPLCGKTRDMAWLLASGYRVVGAELSELAVQQFFEDTAVSYTVTEVGRHKCYSAVNLDLFVGDLFDLDAEQLGAVDAVYDRAALVALPEHMRPRYTRQIRLLTGVVPQLLLTFDYDQSQMAGPPFSISDEEVTRHYGDAFKIQHLVRKPVIGGLKTLDVADEDCRLLTLAMGIR